METQNTTRPASGPRVPEHTPTPWHRNIRPITKYPIIFAGEAPNHSYCFSFHVPREVTPEQAEANCDFVLRACNSHDSLVEAVAFALECAEVPIHDATERRAKGERLMTTLRAALKLARGE